MKEVQEQRDMRFSAAFNRRLVRLYKALDEYLFCGNSAPVLPALLACAAYIWGRNPFITKLKKGGR